MFMMLLHSGDSPFHADRPDCTAAVANIVYSKLVGVWFAVRIVVSRKVSHDTLSAHDDVARVGRSILQVEAT